MQAGLAVNPDYNSGTLDGVAKMQFNIRGTERWNTYKAYLKPVRGRDNLKIVTGARVNRLIVEDGAVVGVEVDVEGIATEAYAAETVLCAGALDSPRVLLRSGIGPAEELRDLGVDTILDLPGVGRNLQDHLLSPVIFETTAREVGPPTPGLAAAQTHHFWRSREGLDSPDTQPLNFSVPMYSEEWMSGPEFGLLAHGRPRPAREPRLGHADRTGRRRPDRHRPQRVRRGATSRRSSPRCASAARSVGSPLWPPNGVPVSSTPALAWSRTRRCRLCAQNGDHLPPPGRHVRHGHGT